MLDMQKKGSDGWNDWGPTQEAAIWEIKTKLISAVCDDGVSEVELQTDVSTKGIGAVLFLQTLNGSRLITFVSR